MKQFGVKQILKQIGIKGGDLNLFANLSKNFLGTFGLEEQVLSRWNKFYRKNESL